MNVDKSLKKPVMCSHFTFLEVSDFDLDDFIPYMGWIGAKPVKIYTQEHTTCYYLYDEEICRLFEIQRRDQKADNTALQYQQVLDGYRSWKISVSAQLR